MKEQRCRGDLVICGGHVVTPFRVLAPGAVTIRMGRIVAVEEGAVRPENNERTIHAEGLTVAPGMIDVHVHGGAGYDTMDSTPEAIGCMARFFAQHGVTSFLPTTIAATRREILAAIENVARCMDGQPDGAEVLGIHLEGPFLSHAKPGAQPKRHIRAADPAEYSRFFQAGPVRLITLAPEIPGSRELISFAVEHGATVAVGHSAATYEGVLEAVSLGLNQSSHTFNAMEEPHHRRPGTVGAVLDCDDISAQVIVDLVHVHPAWVRVLVRLKGPERMVLITDAMRAAGMPDGTYDVGDQQVTVRGGEARIPAGNLAGSTLTMDRAVRNVVEVADLDLPEALAMATITPARAIGVADRKGSLQPGKDADLVLLDGDCQVVMTMVRGRMVHQAMGVGLGK